MLMTPTHASQLILPNVLILDSPNPNMAAIPMKTAVHAPCEETALRAMDKLSIPAPETKTQSKMVSTCLDRDVGTYSTT
jgi:hypothetical protein